MNNNIAAYPPKNKRKKTRGCAITVCLLLSALIMISVLFPPFIKNLLFASFEEYYFIPDQSSVFTFQPTRFGNGSEYFWLYGEDKSNYYFNDFDNDKENNVVFPKNEVALCPGFDPENVRKWCRSKLYMINGKYQPDYSEPPKLPNAASSNTR